MYTEYDVSVLNKNLTSRAEVKKNMRSKRIEHKVIRFLMLRRVQSSIQKRYKTGY